jgi:surface antigen
MRVVVAARFAPVALIALLVGCSNTGSNPGEAGSKEADGQMFGSILGSTIGNFIPNGGSVAGQVLKSNAGTLGMLIGGSIGAALDEEDRRKLDEATRKAFESGAATKFSNPSTGIKATVTPAAIAKSADGKQCRSAKQDVVLPDGKILTETVKACKGASGAWEV